MGVEAALIPLGASVVRGALKLWQLVAGTLDQVELFGATLSGASRRYPLSVACTSLTADGGPRGYAASGRRVEDLPATGSSSAAGRGRARRPCSSGSRSAARGGTSPAR